MSFGCGCLAAAAAAAARHVRAVHLLHDDDGEDGGRRQTDVPRGAAHVPHEPVGAESEGDGGAREGGQRQPRRGVVHAECGRADGARDQARVAHQHAGAALQQRVADGDEAQQAVPRRVVRPAFPLLVQPDGGAAGERAAEPRQRARTVQLELGAARQTGAEEGAAWGKGEDRLDQQEAEL